MINEIDKAVAEYLDEIGTKCEITLYKAGHSKADPANNTAWDCDWWRVSFDGTTFDFFTGIGHRVPKRSNYGMLSSKDQAEAKRLAKLWKLEKLGQLIMPTGDKVSIDNRRTIDSFRETVTMPPTQASVLYCLLLDRSVLDLTFRDWCHDYGYSDDSISARDLYYQCQEEAQKVGDIFNREQLEKLDELLEDY